METPSFKVGDVVRVVKTDGMTKRVIKEGIVIEAGKDAVRVCDPKETAEVSNLKFCEFFPISCRAGQTVELIKNPSKKEEKAMEEILKWL